MKREDITPDIVREFLDYDPDTGVFTWKKRGRHWFRSDRAMNAWNSRHGGKVAGAVKASENGYVCIFIRIFQIPFYAHRLAWMHMRGENPPDMIDHEDRDATNNVWHNIRDAGDRNQRNLSMMSHNTSGATGVHWYKSRSKWQAFSHYKGKRYHLGYFTKKEDAVNAVQRFRENKDYSDYHGKFIACYKEKGTQ